MANKTALQQMQENSSYSKKSAEKLDYSYYDTMTVSATLMNRMYVIPLGQGGKTKADTNFTLAGTLPQGQNLKVFVMKLFYLSNAPRSTADLLAWYRMLYETTLEVKIPGKDSMGLWTLAEIFGIPSLFNLIPTVAGDNIPMVLPAMPGKLTFNNPLVIGSVQSFEIQIEHQVAPAAALYGDKLKVSLNGRLIRLS